MNRYITGAAIKTLREKKHYTQSRLAELLGVSDKAVSKWETGKGLPDITLVEKLAKALGVSVIELMTGAQTENRNRSANPLRSKFYACPICGNVLVRQRQRGGQLPPLEAEPCDDAHRIAVERVEDGDFVTVRHGMTKDHFISFLAWVTTGRVQLVKLYPEGGAQTRFQLWGMGRLYAYCNQHGLMDWK